MEEVEMKEVSEGADEVVDLPSSIAGKQAPDSTVAPRQHDKITNSQPVAWAAVAGETSDQKRGFA